jgi:hypothetical protein
MEKGYCSYCEKISKAKREDIDIALIVILAIFTAGIGVLIYLIIFYSKHEKSLCVKCNSKLKPLTGKDAISQEEIKPLINPYKKGSKEAEEEITTEDRFLTGKQLQLCPYCGQNIEMGVKICPNCQSNLE